MASLKKVLSKVVSHSRSSSMNSKTSRNVPNGDAQPVANGNAEKVKHTTFDEANAGISAAQKQQKADDHDLQRPKSMPNGDNRLSFTEQKEDRRVEREAHDDEEYRARKERMRKAHEEVRFFTRLLTPGATPFAYSRYARDIAVNSTTPCQPVTVLR